MRKRWRTKQAFTLIEILVVIAIISLLAAILFPVFARARANARRAGCMSNEKQLALGLMQYAQDYDGRLMATWSYTSLEPWHVLLQPYVKSYQVFRCPDVHSFYLGMSYKDSAYFPTYGLPGMAYTASIKDIYSQFGTPLSMITEPARTWMIVETCYNSPTSTYYVDRGYGYPYVNFNGVAAGGSPEGSSYFVSDRHMGGSNVAFADGHVKWIKQGTGKNYIANLNSVP